MNGECCNNGAISMGSLGALILAEVVIVALGRVRRLELNALEGEASDAKATAFGMGDSAALRDSGARLKVRAGSLLRCLLPLLVLLVLLLLSVLPPGTLISFEANAIADARKALTELDSTFATSPTSEEGARVAPGTCRTAAAKAVRGLSVLHGLLLPPLLIPPSLLQEWLALFGDRGLVR